MQSSLFDEDNLLNMLDDKDAMARVDAAVAVAQQDEDPLVRESANEVAAMLTNPDPAVRAFGMGLALNLAFWSDPVIRARMEREHLIITTDDEAED